MKLHSLFNVLFAMSVSSLPVTDVAEHNPLASMQIWPMTSCRTNLDQSSCPRHFLPISMDSSDDISPLDSSTGKRKLVERYGSGIPDGWKIRIIDCQIAFLNTHGIAVQKDPRNGVAIVENSDNCTVEKSFALVQNLLGDLPVEWKFEIRTDNLVQFYRFKIGLEGSEEVQLETTFDDIRFTGPRKSWTLERKYGYFLNLVNIMRRSDRYLSSFIKIRDRNNIFYESVAIIMSNDMAFTRKLLIRFEGETGIDYGGLRREYFLHLSQSDIYKPSYGLFKQVSSESTSHKLELQTLDESLSAVNSRYLEFTGRLIAIALLNNNQLDFSLSPAIYRAIKGQETFILEDLADVEPEIYRGLKMIREINDVSTLSLTFTVPSPTFNDPKGTYNLRTDNQISSEEHLVDLYYTVFGTYCNKAVRTFLAGPDIDVDDFNKEEYISLYTNWLMRGRSSEALKHISKGFGHIMSSRAIDSFYPQELDNLVSGSGEISYDDWILNTNYENYDPKDDIIKWFWNYVRGADMEVRRKILAFATGTTRLPLGGFGNLHGSGYDGKVFPFAIIRAEGDGLPTSHTCFNQIEIPAGYETEALFEERFTQAISWSGGFDELHHAGHAGPVVNHED